MAEVEVTSSIGSTQGNALQQLLMADDIQPGDEPSYETCKITYIYHPLGDKIAAEPVRVALSQQREISISAGPETMCREEFNKVWEEIGADNLIMQTKVLSRVYGASTVAIGQEGKNGAPLDITKLHEGEIYFSVFDPLNTAGSLVLNQNPNAPDFLKKLGAIKVSGEEYHPSRVHVVFNEQPIYLAFTSSSYGYVGRSVYQRILYPLKTFIQSMVTDDLVTFKAGVIIAKMRQPGSIVDNIMQLASNVKRALVKIAITGNVLSIQPDEEIETLNLQNTDGAMTTARKNVLDNIASGAPMPAKMLNSETFAEGFGEGTEDAKVIARYIDGLRKEMKPLYLFFDNIVMRRAWSPAFFERVQKLFPVEYGKKDYEAAFYEWKNSFIATWPSLLKEPPSEEIKVQETMLKSLIALLEVVLPVVDPENKVAMITAALDNINSLKLMFPVEFDFDPASLEEWLEEERERELEAAETALANGPAEPKPFAAAA